MEKSVFQILNEYDITEHLKKKDRIIYLPWSKAWMIVKSLFPSAKFTINKAADGCIYHTDGKTAWVEVSITINDQTETESLAVMDFRNKSIPIDTITSADAEKSIKRCLVKCAALHGLGLSLWTGEELSSAARKKKEDDLDDVKQEILSVVAGKLEAGVSKDTIYKAIESVAGVKNPNATHWREEYQVWLLSKEDFDNICAIDNDDWKDDWGWWRHAYGSNLGAVDCAYVINGEKLMAWDGLQRKEWCRNCSDCAGTEKDKDECFHDHQYPDILIYLCDEIGASTERNVCACTIDLARQNNLTLAEFFKKYLG